MKFCNCEYHDVNAIKKNNRLVCSRCNKPMVCEFSYLDNEPPHAATLIHVDYFVCKRHEDTAVNNVVDRDNY